LCAPGLISGDEYKLQQPSMRGIYVTSNCCATPS